MKRDIFVFNTFAPIADSNRHRDNELKNTEKIVKKYKK